MGWEERKPKTRGLQHVLHGPSEGREGGRTAEGGGGGGRRLSSKLP